MKENNVTREFWILCVSLEWHCYIWKLLSSLSPTGLFVYFGLLHSFPSVETLSLSSVSNTFHKAIIIITTYAKNHVTIFK